jgi:hypothetical protein
MQPLVMTFLCIGNNQDLETQLTNENEEEYFSGTDADVDAGVNRL